MKERKNHRNLGRQKKGVGDRSGSSSLDEFCTGNNNSRKFTKEKKESIKRLTFSSLILPNHYFYTQFLKILGLIQFALNKKS